MELSIDQPVYWNYQLKPSIDQSVYRDAIASKLAQSPMKISYSKRRAPIFQLMPSTMHRCQCMVMDLKFHLCKGVSKCLGCGKWCSPASSWGSWPGLGLESSLVLIWPCNPSCLFCSCEFSFKVGLYQVLLGGFKSSSTFMIGIIWDWRLLIIRPINPSACSPPDQLSAKNRFLCWAGFTFTGQVGSV